MKCHGNELTICGGPGALSLFVQVAALDSGLSVDYSSLTASLPSGWSIAPASCVAEGTTGRALSAASTSSGSMTIPMCLNFCQDKGFQFAGIEYAGECICDNALSNGASLQATSSNCHMPCSGMPGTICGGPGALSLYQNPSLAAVQTSVAASTATIDSAVTTPVESTVTAAPAIELPSGWSVASSACIHEVGGRALNGASTASGSMTIPICIDFCESKGFQYAGIEYAGECYCGNDFVNGASLSYISEQCTMKCSGDSSTICGGPDAISLWHNPSVSAPALPSGTTAAPITVETVPPQPVALSSGWSVASTVCLAEGTSGRALAGASTASGSMTINMCLDFCQSKGFQYAGIEYSAECFCSNNFSNGASLSLPSSNCVMPCAGDSTTTCGGPGSLSLFNNPSLAVSAPSSFNVFSQKACIQEVGGRALTGASTATGDMTIEKCTSYCVAAGFSMAGMEYSSECYCGNDFSNGASLSLTSGSCNMPCSGNAQETCGGPGSISIYTTS